jgi:hypothetical protein
LADADANALALEVDVTADVCLDDMVGLVEVPPVHTDFDLGSDVYPFAFDDLGDGPKASQVALDVCMSEQGYLYIRGDADAGETLRFENRFARTFAPLEATFDETQIANEADALAVPSDLSNILNDVDVQTIARRRDAAATTVLIRLEGPVRVDPGAAGVRLFVDYRDPANESTWIGGQDLVQPLANTDWTANAAEDGSGANKTSAVTVTLTEFGSRAMLELVSTDPDPVYVRGGAGVAGLGARGRGLYRYSPITSQGQNAASIAIFGLRQLAQPMVLPYQGDSNIGQSIADFTANINAGLSNTPTRVRVRTETDDDLTAHGILRDIGDRIAITESVTACDAAEVIISGVEQELDADGLLKTWWTVEIADTSDYLIFDTGMFDVNVFGWE